MTPRPDGPTSPHSLHGRRAGHPPRDRGQPRLHHGRSGAGGGPPAATRGQGEGRGPAPHEGRGGSTSSSSGPGSSSSSTERSSTRTRPTSWPRSAAKMISGVADTSSCASCGPICATRSGCASGSRPRCACRPPEPAKGVPHPAPARHPLRPGPRPTRRVSRPSYRLHPLVRRLTIRKAACRSSSGSFVGSGP